MARFTSLLVRRNLQVRYVLPMGIILLEPFINIRMAFFTGLRSYILASFLLRLLLAEG
jgi:hypothetical protein